MNAKEAANASKRAEQERLRREEEDKRARCEEYIARAIEDAYSAINKAVNNGHNERLAFSDVMFVYDNADAMDRIMTPLKADGYKVEYVTGTGRDFAANREWTFHKLRIEW